RSTDAVTADRAVLTLARLGGDEFAVLLDDITDVSDAVRVTERLRHSLQLPFDVEGNQVFLSATAGIAVSSTGYDRPEDILRDAAPPLHGPTGPSSMPYELFDPAMRARAASRLQLETELQHAIANHSFVNHYQPIVSLATGHIAGFEALIRWQHPVR